VSLVVGTCRLGVYRDTPHRPDLMAWNPLPHILMCLLVKTKVVLEQATLVGNPNAY
jgi:hypothetical protein